jgi:hypothetical protein
MAPLIVRHPVLLNNWMMAREEALARVRAQPTAEPQAISDLNAALKTAVTNAEVWHSEHSFQVRKLHDLRRDLALLSAALGTWDWNAAHPWDALWTWGAKGLTYEGQEALLSLMLEPHGALIDDLADHMGAEEAASFRINGAMHVAELRRILETDYAWALGIDFTSPENIARFWYVSEEKLEPRLGERATEDGATLEQPLCIARLISELYATVRVSDDSNTVAALLLAHPEHRYVVRRAQITKNHPYAEVHDNLIAADLLPINLLRCKLAFFGASQFDPRSDRWVRINLFAGAPFPDDLNSEGAA